MPTNGVHSTRLDFQNHCFSSLNPFRHSVTITITPAMSDPAIRIRVGAAVDRNIGRRFSRSLTPLVTHVVRSKPRWIGFGHPWRRRQAAQAGKAGQGPVRRSRGRTSDANQVVAIGRRKQAPNRRPEEFKAQRRADPQRPSSVKDRERAEFQHEGRKRSARWKQTKADVQKKTLIRTPGGRRLSKRLERSARSGALGSIAEAPGVQTDLGSYIGQSVELETRAANFLPRHPTSNGTRANRSTLVNSSASRVT